MLKTKKILSVLLSLVMMFGIFSVAAFAESSVITEISIDVDIDAGMLVGDINDFLTIKTEGLELDDDEGSSPISVYKSDDYFLLNDDEAFEDDIAYDIFIYLCPMDGYEFDYSMKYVTVNGVKTKEFYLDYNENDNIGIYLYGYQTNEIPFTGTYVEKAEIKFDTNIGGIYVNDYETYIRILSHPLEFEDNYGELAVYVYDSNGDKYYKQYKKGETYSVSIYLSPQEGYKLSGYVEGYINGNEVYTYVSDWTPGEEYGDTVVEYVCLEYEFTVDGEKEFTIFERIINFFRNLFDKFLSLFRADIMPVL